MPMIFHCDRCAKYCSVTFIIFISEKGSLPGRPDSGDSKKYEVCTNCAGAVTGFINNPPPVVGGMLPAVGSGGSGGSE